MTPKRVILHCSYSPNGDASYDTNRILDLHTAMKRADVEWNGQTMKGRGFRDIGYHYIIEVSGHVVKGRGDTEQGAHTYGQNHDSLGICMVGTDQFTKAQWETLRVVLQRINLNYKISPDQFYLHREFSKKTCPGYDLRTILCWYYTGHVKYVQNHLIPVSLVPQLPE